MSPTSNGYEVMDLCFGHPQMAGGYHYHHQASKVCKLSELYSIQVRVGGFDMNS